MGKYSTKIVFQIMLLHTLISSSSGARSGKPIVNGVCTSEFKNLNVCKAFNGNTCCSASRMQRPSFTIENQTQMCYDKVFEACSDAYCSSNASNKVITPCETNEGMISGTASQGVSIGKQFWDAASLIFKTADNSTEATWGQTMFTLIEVMSIAGIVRSFVEVILRRLL